MGTPKKKIVTATFVDLYDRLIATIPEIERKGAANPYTSLNGNMFTLLQQSRTLAIRLAEGKGEEFLRRYKSRLFKSPLFKSPWSRHERVCGGARFLIE